MNNGKTKEGSSDRLSFLIFNKMTNKNNNLNDDVNMSKHNNRHRKHNTITTIKSLNFNAYGQKITL